jgi:hypothetical protein
MFEPGEGANEFIREIKANPAKNQHREEKEVKQKTNKLTGESAKETLLGQRQFLGLGQKQEKPNKNSADQNKKENDSGHEPQCEGKLKRGMSDKLSPHEE